MVVRAAALETKMTLSLEDSTAEALSRAALTLGLDVRAGFNELSMNILLAAFILAGAYVYVHWPPSEEYKAMHNIR